MTTFVLHYLQHENIHDLQIRSSSFEVSIPFLNRLQFQADKREMRDGG